MEKEKRDLVYTIIGIVIGILIGFVGTTLANTYTLPNANNSTIDNNTTIQEATDSADDTPTARHQVYNLHSQHDRTYDFEAHYSGTMNMAMPGYYVAAADSKAGQVIKDLRPSDKVILDYGWHITIEGIIALDPAKDDSVSIRDKIYDGYRRVCFQTGGINGIVVAYGEVDPDLNFEKPVSSVLIDTGNSPA